MSQRAPRSSTRPRGALATSLVAVTAALATGCGGISTAQEQRIGAEYAAEINSELPIVDAPALNDYIHDLGRRIASAGTRNIPYRFFIVNAEPVNAFAIPGGYVYVNRGLIEQTDNLMELAGALAHEIGHVEKRHSVEQIERVQSANLGLNLAYILLGRAPSGIEQAAIGVGGSLVFANYSRDAENEADAVAIDLLMDAGIDPRGLLTFFRELLSLKDREPGALGAWFSTHPTTRDRIDATEARIEAIPAARLSGLQSDAAAFQAFQERMSDYPAPPPEYRVAGR